MRRRVARRFKQGGLEAAGGVGLEAGTRVADVMTTTVVTVAPGARLEAAARQLRAHHVSGLPVVERPHHVVGMLSESDIVESLHRATGVRSARGLLDLLLGSAPPKGESMLEVCRRHLHNGRVADAMTSPAATVDRDAPVEEAARLLRVHGVKRLAVLDAHGDLVGVVTPGDIVQAASGERRARRGALRPGPAPSSSRASGPFEDV